METKVYTRSEIMFFVRDFKESSEKIVGYCNRHNVDVYQLKRWLKQDNFNKNNNAGLTAQEARALMDSGSKQAHKLTTQIKNNFVCIAPQKKRVTRIVKTTASSKEDEIKQQLAFRQAIDDCCCKLLELGYNESNKRLLLTIQEAL